MAQRVVAARPAHDIDEFLVDFIEQRIGFLLTLRAAIPVPDILPAPFLIEGFKHQPVVIIAESLRQLCPDALIFIHALILLIRLGKTGPPAAVPVDI